MVPKSTIDRAAVRVPEASIERPPVREEMKPARGLLVGLALSAIFWLGLLVIWAAF